MVPKHPSFMGQLRGRHSNVMAKEYFLTGSNQSRLGLPGMGSEGKLSRALLVAVCIVDIVTFKARGNARGI